MKKRVVPYKDYTMSSNSASKVISRRVAISKLAAISTGLGIAVIAAGVGGYLVGTQTAPEKTIERTVTAPAAEKTVTVERTIEKTVTMTGTPATTTPTVPIEELVLNKLKELEPKTPVTLRCWALSDVPMDPPIAAFNEVFPNVKIIKTAAEDEVALMTALRTGAEVYDVLRVQLYTIPSLAALGLLEDISKYIIPELVDGIPDWALASSTGGLGDIGKTWFAVPQDVGPCLHAYRKDIFSKFGIDPPRTWEEYAEAARKIHKMDSNVYITSADTTAFFAQVLTAYMQQVDGGIARPIGKGQFEIILDSPQNRRVAEYWGELIDEELLLVSAGFSDEWIRAVKEDRLVSFPWAAAWFPGFVLKGVFPELAGKWELVDVPQWKDAKRFVAYNFGGSALAVTKTAVDVKAAALFAQWITQATKAVELGWYYPGIWPANTKRLREIKAFHEPWDYFEGKSISGPYIKAQESIAPENVVAIYGQPFWQPYLGLIPKYLGDAVAGKFPWSELFTRLNDEFIPAVEDMGFEVKEVNGKLIATLL